MWWSLYRAKDMGFILHSLHLAMNIIQKNIIHGMKTVKTGDNSGIGVILSFTSLEVVST
jgi:hypothetical protein